MAIQIWVQEYCNLKLQNFYLFLLKNILYVDVIVLENLFKTGSDLRKFI